MTAAVFSDLWQHPAPRPPLVVAELSGNHNRSLGRALELIEAAADCGADAIKLQTYTADTITLDVAGDEFVVRKPGSAWDGRTLHSLYEEAHTPWEWHQPLIERASALGLQWFSSPFDFTAVDFLETLGVPCYKIASPEIIDLPLIRKCAATGKPLILSTGMAGIAEIAEAVAAARDAGASRLVLLKCTTDYPARAADSNLLTIPHLAQMFDCPAGVSDHTPGIGAAIAATVLGAVLIEKHLTLRRADGGPDAHFSLEPHEMKSLVVESRAAWESLGKVSYGPTAAEKDFLRGRRSLYVCKDVLAGEILTRENVRSIRPGYGISPKHLDSIAGKKARCHMAKGTPLRWEAIG